VNHLGLVSVIMSLQLLAYGTLNLSFLIIESLGPINDSAVSFLGVLGRLIVDISGEVREVSFLFQWLSVLIQRFNAILLHDSFIDEEAGTGIPA